MLYIFSGPSLSQSYLRKRFSGRAVVLDPVKGGDILSLLSNQLIDRPTHLHIIDGFYYNVPSVRHKEIIQAIDQGIIVSGCSSMGAIRAAECHEFGMIGTGRVFEFFRDNFVSGDDEVAVTHESCYPFRVSSTPLINIRLTLKDLVEQGAIDIDLSTEIINHFKVHSFSERHIKSLMTDPKLSCFSPILSKHYRDWKNLDALASLDELTNMTLDTKVASRGFFSGYNHVNFYNDAKVENSEVSIDLNLLPGHLSSLTDYPKVLYDASNRALAVKFAKHLSMKNTPSELCAFRSFVDQLKYSTYYFSFLPFGYKNLTDELVDQELLILKLQLWLIDTAGLSGNLGVLTDYVCRFYTSIVDPENDASGLLKSFYPAFQNLLLALHPDSPDLCRKYLGISLDDALNSSSYTSA